MVALLPIIEGVLYLSMIRDLYDYNHERIQNKTGVEPLTLRHYA